MQKIRRTKMRIMIALYLGLMLFFYLGYVLLDDFRLNKSEQWLKMDTLTGSDVQSIQQLNLWTNTFELSLLGTFILAVILLYRYRKSGRILAWFIMSHLCIFTALFLLGYVLSLFITAPIGNVTQPLIFPIYLFIIIVIYAVFVGISKRLTQQRE